MSSIQETNTTELRHLYRDVQMEVLRLYGLTRKDTYTKTHESLRLLENYEKNLKEELLRRGEDI